MRALPVVVTLLGLSALGCAANFPADGIFDWDGDGYGKSDCDDLDAAVHPGGDERCDDAKKDEDCDGLFDDDDLDVDNPATWHRDQDGDGYGDPDNTEEHCKPSDGFVADGTDCDDEDPGLNPGEAEACDDARQDEDCDGQADDDDDDATGKTTLYVDSDGDGYGEDANPEAWCHPPSDLVDDGTDCDDGDGDVHPRAKELCNGIDDDCDSGIDDADPEGPTDGDRWYGDADGDGYGAGSAYDACEGDPGDVSSGGDCDDADESVNPGESEVCNDGIDQDCDYSGDDCFVRGEVSSSDGDAIVKGANLVGVWGWAMASGGDTDGDGLDEVWVTGKGQTGSGTGTGGAFGVAGRLSGTVTAADAGLVVVQSLAVTELGSTVASGYDLDGDGLDDLVLGAPLADPGGNDQGLVVILPGPVATGADETAALATLEGNESDDYVGWSVAVGDFDGDGVGDLFAAEPNDDVVTGLLGPFAQDERWTTSSYDVRCSAESYIHLAMGDLTGDGKDDLLVGDYGYSRAWVYEGGQTGSLDSYDRLATFDSTYSSISLGFAVLANGDYDGDGYNDMVLGAPVTDDNRGMVYVVEGPVSGDYDDTDVDLELRAEDEDSYLGYGLALSVDANDNGRAELLVGAPQAEGGKGVVYVLDGSPSSGTRTTADVDDYVVGARAGGELGLSLGAADIDGDGWTDILVGGDDISGGIGGVSLFYGAGR